MMLGVEGACYTAGVVFTGLVEDVGHVARADRRSDALVLVIRPRHLAVAELAVGESICHDGTCLTVTGVEQGTYSVLAGGAWARTSTSNARCGSAIGSAATS